MERYNLSCQRSCKGRKKRSKWDQTVNTNDDSSRRIDLADRLLLLQVQIRARKIFFGIVKESPPKDH